ncbi:single-stranded-DNA-specific exonuclease RecJ [Mucilaginibacter koreensis]
MNKRWSIKQQPERSRVIELATALSIDPVLSTILLQRGVNDFEEARYYFKPDIRHLHDPFLMSDMEQAVLRIETAIAAGERILIYGDYDVDGTTAVALVYSFFKKLYDQISYYIPDRHLEGYGISTQGIDYAAEHGYSLIIALDCGIKSIDKVEYATQKNIDFIIADHHLPGEILPAAVAVLDPKRKDCPYPYKELSGCGLGFKLIQAYSEKNNIPFDDYSCYLELVAISIACDIVHITGENRVLAHFGLQQLNNDACHGVQALMEVAGKTGNYSIGDIVFLIGPRINAAGRIGDAKQAVELLLSSSLEEARDTGSLINIKNVERKGHDMSITDEALSMIESSEDMLSRKSTVVFNEGWHKGVIGIVASRLTEKYYRPTVVLTRSNGHVAGSARSVLGFDLYEALSDCSDLLLQYGGHKYAAGLTMKPEKVEAFMQRFEEVVSNNITTEQLIQEIQIDAELDLHQVDARFFRLLNRFAPFGPENMSPVFLSRGVQVCGRAGLAGSNHLKMAVSQDGSAMFDCIAFNQAGWLHEVNQGKPFDICYTIEENIWRDKRSIQLNIKGIRISE